MEAEAKSLIADLKTAVAMDPVRARKFLTTVFDGKLTATPIDTDSGARLQIAGQASLAAMLVAEGLGGGQDQNPPEIRVPDGIRTRVSGVKSRGPGPLDDGDQGKNGV